MTQHVQSSSTPEVQPPPALADCTPEQQVYLRYIDALNGLLDDASERRNMRLLADALAWALAQIAVNCGTRPTGDILAYLGKHMMKIADRNEARRELERQREEGHLPN